MNDRKVAIRTTDSMLRQEPETLAEARELLLDVRASITDIQAQLADKDKTDSQGQRLSSIEWNAWRKRAVGAQNLLQQKQARLKLRIEQWEREENAEHRALLDELHDMVESWREYFRVELEPDEHELLVRVRGALGKLETCAEAVALEKVIEAVVEA